MKGTTNERKKEIISSLYSKNEKIFHRIADELSKSSRQNVNVNLSKIEKYAKDKGAVIIPGKVLGNGELMKDVFVIAYSFSDSAYNKLKKKLTIKEFIDKNQKIKGLQILK